MGIGPFSEGGLDEALGLAVGFGGVGSCADVAPGDTIAAALGINYLNDMAFWSNPATDYTLASVPFTAEMHQQLEEVGGIYNATSPDLEAFRALGGKIIIYHSWADQAIPPFATIDTTGPSPTRWEDTRLFNPSAVST